MQRKNAFIQLKICSGCLQSPLRVWNSEEEVTLFQKTMYDVGVEFLTDVGPKPCQATRNQSDEPDTARFILVLQRRPICNVVAEWGIMDRRVACYVDVEEVRSDMISPNTHMSRRSAR